MLPLPFETADWHRGKAGRVRSSFYDKIIEGKIMGSRWNQRFEMILPTMILSFHPGQLDASDPQVDPCHFCQRCNGK